MKVDNKTQKSTEAKEIMTPEVKEGEFKSNNHNKLPAIKINNCIIVLNKSQFDAIAPIIDAAGVGPQMAWDILMGISRSAIGGCVKTYSIREFYNKPIDIIKQIAWVNGGRKSDIWFCHIAINIRTETPDVVHDYRGIDTIALLNYVVNLIVRAARDNSDFGWCQRGVRMLIV